MAPSKRKRNSSNRTSSTKRQKTKATDTTYDPEQLWEVKDILAEDKNRYLINWKDNSVTGQSYTPTWEPKSFANEEAIADWERKKRRPAAVTERGQSIGLRESRPSHSESSTKSEIDGENRAKGSVEAEHDGSHPKDEIEDSSYPLFNLRDHLGEAKAQEQRHPSLSSFKAEIEDSFELKGTVHLPRALGFSVEILPSSDFDRSQYLECCGSITSDTHLDTQSLYSDDSDPEDSTFLVGDLPGGHALVSVPLRIDPETIIPDSQPLPSPLNHFIISSSASASRKLETLHPATGIARDPHLIIHWSSSEEHVRNPNSKSFVASPAARIEVPATSLAAVKVSQESRSITDTVNGLSGFFVPTSSQLPGGTSASAGRKVSLGSQEQVKEATSSSTPNSWLTVSKPILIAPVLSSSSQVDLLSKDTGSGNAYPERQSQGQDSNNTEQGSTSWSNSVGPRPSQSVGSSLPLPPFHNSPTTLNSNPSPATEQPPVDPTIPESGQRSFNGNLESTTNQGSNDILAFQTQVPLSYPTSTPENSRVEHKADADLAAPSHDHYGESTELAEERAASPLADIDIIDHSVGTPAEIWQGGQIVSRIQSPCSQLTSNQDQGDLDRGECSQLTSDQDQGDLDCGESCPLSSSLLRSELLESVEARYFTNASELLTPKQETMTEVPRSSSAPSGTSLKERLRALRAASAAARHSEGSSSNAPSTRSTSVIPAFASERLPELNNHPSSAPTQGLIVDIDRNGTGQGVQALSQVMAGLSQSSDSFALIGVPSLGKDEFIVPLPMWGRVRNYYRQAVWNHKDDIEAFMLTRTPQENLKNRMKEMINCVQNFTIHADLEDPTALVEPSGLSPETEADWAKICSAKFEFLSRLLVAVSHLNIQIAILAKPGPLLNIVENFLRGHDVSCMRADTQTRSDSSADSNVHVTLYPTGPQGARMIVGRVQAVIGLDSTFDVNEKHVATMRSHVSQIDELVPAIHLIVTNTAEHIERCLTDDLDPTLRLQLLVCCIARARHDVGRLPTGCPNPIDAAELIAQHLGHLDCPMARWPLPPLGEVAGTKEILEDLASGGEDQATQQPDETEAEMENAPPSRKRSLQSPTDEAAEPCKKQRRQLAPDALTGAETVESKDGYESSNEMRQTIAQLRAELGQRNQLELEFRQTLASTEDRLRDYGRLMNQVRSEHEDMGREVGMLRKERQVLVTAAVQMGEQRQIQSEEIRKLRESQARLEAELREAREALISSSVPEKATLERAQAKSRQAQAETTRLEKRLASMQQDFDFTRTQYQAASTAAAEASVELAAVRQRNVVLEQLGTGEAIRSRDATIVKQNEMYQEEVRRLQLTIDERETFARRIYKRVEQMQLQLQQDDARILRDAPTASKVDVQPADNKTIEA